MISQFTGKDYLKFELNEETHLILLRDKRSKPPSKRWQDTPFPLLSNCEEFSSTLGEYAEELQAYGIRTRAKYDDQLPLEVISSTHIYMSYHTNVNTQSNRYLRKQYSRLRKYSKNNETEAYWNLCLNLIRFSWSFKLASLNSWKPTWYKEFSCKDLQKLWLELNKIVNLEVLQSPIRNVWIESPRTKFRQLCIPSKAWRLNSHMLTLFLSYIYNSSLSPEEHEGFLYGRGTFSWWKDVLWGDWLTKYPNLIELDLSSAFPSIHLKTVRKALLSEGLIPESIINLILTNLKSPNLESTQFPTFESYVENKYNRLWRTSDRSVPMGNPVCPLLFVITLNWVLNSINLKNENLKYKFYADDGSVYFSLKGLFRFYMNQKSYTITQLIKDLLTNQNILVSLLNSNETVRWSGLKFCSQKSSLVRFQWLWLKSFKSLGLELFTPLCLWNQMLNLIKGLPIPLHLKGNTRGRGSNPLTGQRGTTGSNTLLDFSLSSNSPKLDLNLLKIKYKKYFGLILSLLYSSPSLEEAIHRPRSKKTIYTKYYKLLKTSTKKSLNMNRYNIGCKLNQIYLTILSNEVLDFKWKQLDNNLLREIQYNWKTLPNWQSKLQSIPDPLQHSPPLTLEEFELSRFRKYSELKIDSETYLTLQQEYSKILTSHVPT